MIDNTKEKTYERDKGKWIDIQLYKYSCERCTLGNRKLTQQSLCKKCIESGTHKYFKLRKGLE